MDDLSVTEAGYTKVRAFGKDVLVYSAGNGLLIIFGAIQTLIIPKFLSVEQYGYWQLFILYGLYFGILQLGFNDGILVRWAGKDLSQIGNEIGAAMKFLVLEQLAVIIPLGLVVYFLLQPSLRWIALMLFIYAFIMNLACFFMFTTQAIRQFKFLTAFDVVRGLIFLALVVLIFVSGHHEYQYIVVAWLAAYALYICAFAFRYRLYLWGKDSSTSFLTSFGKKNINVGIFVLLGNFVFVICSTLDRLLVSSFFTIDQFAVYAFAMSVVNIAFVLINAVSYVIFPHLSAAPDQWNRAYHLGKWVLIQCWAAFLVAYFPLAMLIEFYLPQYTGSLPIIKILLGTVGFSSLILILHVTYYRLYQKQRQYLITSLTELALAVLLAMVAISIMGNL